ncbi:hypothetical protein Tcan_16911 [Toxocara canis]|uniref:DUF19 domain-containing protein n=1 Tax=Toxocara canis TaxID=6265 RepID=A0A0B2VVC7_TOXCA|nr:hypothetical protein Tcan_16911 [Toxocara canis]
MKECIEKHGAEKCNRWEETCARIMAKPLARHHGQPNTAAFNYGAVASCLQRLQEDPMKLCVDMYGKETCSKFEKACADKLSAEKVNSAGSFSSEAIDCVLAQFNA